jgi:hypothetical protein
MRKISFLLLTALFFIGCGKFEEGPRISFLSVKSRVMGEWTLVKYMVDGDDMSEAYLNGRTEEFKFQADNVMEYKTLSNDVVEGNWEIEDDMVLMELKMTTPDGLPYIEQDTLPLVRLTNKEMWARYENGIEKHFSAK